MKTLPLDPDNTNEQYARHANDVLALYGNMTNAAQEDCVADLLTGLMHSADRSELDFETELARARVNYLSDTTEETS